MNAITVEDIRKVYRGAGSDPVRAVDGVAFEVSKGQIYGLLGPNGAGKTTLVKILTTLTAPSSGRATIYGFDVVRQGLDVRRHIVAVLQQTAVDGLLTVEDNLRIYAYLHGVGANETRTRMAAVMEEFELGSKAQETVQHLSLGTKRRIQVAKIFMVDSPVIFLDESTTGMDPLMRRRVLDRIRLEAKNGRTVLLTTQVLSEAEELCDTIMIIKPRQELGLRQPPGPAASVQPDVSRDHDLCLRRRFPAPAAALESRVPPGGWGHGGHALQRRRSPAAG